MKYYEQYQKPKPACPPLSGISTPYSKLLGRLTPILSIFIFGNPPTESLISV